MTYWTRILPIFCVVLAVAAPTTLNSNANAQEPTFIGTNVDERIVVALQVDQAAAQAWLPAGWEVAEIGDGPFTGANLMAVFVDRLLQMNAEGQTAGGGAFRAMAFLVPVRLVNTDNTTNMVIRIYSAHDSEGPYKNSAKADVSRERTSNGSNIGGGSGSETWQVDLASGGSATLAIEYQREVPNPHSQEVKTRSAADPSVSRTYYVNQLVDIVNSAPDSIDRASSFSLEVTVPELASLFDGTQQTIGIAVIPSYARQTFTP